MRTDVMLTLSLLLIIIETIEANLSMGNRLSENENCPVDAYHILFIEK